MGESQGATANKNGHILEETITPALKDRGFIIVSYKDYIKHLDYYNSLDKVAVKQFKFETIYEQQGKTEYVLLGKKIKEPIRIECKWQQSAGSVDEKFPYMYLNAVQKYPENIIFFVVDGSGYKKGSREWIEKRIKENWLNDKGKTIKLFYLSEIIKFINTNFKD